MSNRKPDPASVRFVRGPIHGITEYRLGNGLKVLTMPDETSPIVTSLVVYRVGSRNEGPGNTGSAHFFEHLMFKGSNRFNADKGNNIDELMKEIGGDLNAYTSYDQTVYHEQVTADYLELCLAIEADRMRGLRMRKADRDSEMTVVRNEMEQGENWPEQVMNKQLWAIAFNEHPYHHDVIGARTDVENVPLANMRDFYHTYYWPNNATLILVGGFETETALKLVSKHFGRIPRSPHRIPGVYTVEPKQEGERRFEVRRAGEFYRLAMAFHVPAAVHADMPAIQVLAQVLGSSYSRSSRLYKRLVDSGLATQVFAHAMPMRDPGILEIAADVTENASLSDVEAALRDEIEAIKCELVADDELERIKTGNRKDTLLKLAEPKYFGYQLAQAEAVADWRWLFQSDAAFEKVTAEEVRAAARKYLTRDNLTIGAFIPRNESETVGEDASLATETPEPVAVKPRKVRARKAPEDAVRKTLKRFRGAAPRADKLASRIKSRTLANGLTVNVLGEKRSSGALAVALAIKAGNYFESRDKQNLADVVASMLPMGSDGLSKSELADELTELGIRQGLHFGVGPFLTRATAQIVGGDLGRLLNLLSTVIRKPLFDSGELAKVKSSWIGRYQQEIEVPQAVANNVLGNSIYTEADVFFQKPIAEQMSDLKRMTVDDLRAFHRDTYTPSAVIFTVAGDVDADEVFALVESVFGSWSGPAARSIEVPPFVVAEPRRITVKMPDRPGVQIVLGRALSLKKSDADFHAAQLGLRVLGGDTLTARLGKKLREEGGLTYGVYAGMWDNSYGGAPWHVSLSVNAQNVEPAIATAVQIIADFQANGITESELATQVNNMIGEHQLRITTSMELASRISEYAALGLNLDEIDGYADRLRSLTLEEVNAAIARYFAADNLVTVVAGDV